MRGWNKNINGQYKKEKQQLLKAIDELDNLGGKGGLSPVQRESKAQAELRLGKILKEEEIK